MRSALEVTMKSARYVTAQPPTQGADAGMYDASSEIHKLSTVSDQKKLSQGRGQRSGTFIRTKDQYQEL